MKTFSIFILLLFTVSAIAEQKQGANDIPVNAAVVNPYSIPSAVQENILNRQIPKGPAPDQELIDRLKTETLPVGDGTNITDLSNYQTDAPIFIWNSGYGPNQNGWVPADVDVAYGLGKTIIVTNSQFHVYDVNGAQNYTNSFTNWFNNVGVEAIMFDPRVVFDDWNDRWVMICLGMNAAKTNSWIYVSVSQTNNPNGSWWNWKLNAKMDGGTTTNFWSDLPGLGFSYPTGGTGFAGAIVVGTNQYNTSDAFQYPKVRILKTSQLYTGASVTWYDIWNFNDVGGNKAFTPQPCRQYFSTATSDIFVVSTKSGGGNVINVRRIQNPTAVTPTLTAAATVSVTAYSVPPNAPSLGGSGVVDAGDCRTQSCIYYNGHIYTSFVSSYNWGSGNNAIVQYVRFNVNTNTVARENRFGGNGEWFMHPAAAPEYLNPHTGTRAGISFIRSSSSIYPSFSVIGDDGAALSSYYTVAGTGYLGGGVQRLGDYSGIAVSDAQNGSFIAAGMLARSGSWGTGTFKFAYTGAPTGNEPNTNELPSQYSLSQNYPNPFNPSTQISFAIPKAGLVLLSVYDVLGREVGVLINEHKEAGNYTINFTADNLTSGVYFYKLVTNGFSETKRMLLTK